MKTYQAEEFNKNPSEAYREADLNGRVRINHNHYRDKIFELIARPRREELPEDDEDKETD